MQIIRRLENIERALIGNNGIPEAERLQIIKGNMTEGGFIPDTPGDSIETRKLRLVRHFGSSDGAIFVELVDRFGEDLNKA